MVVKDGLLPWQVLLNTEALEKYHLIVKEGHGEMAAKIVKKDVHILRSTSFRFLLIPETFFAQRAKKYNFDSSLEAKFSHI